MPRPTAVLAGDVQYSLEFDGIEYSCEHASVTMEHEEDDRLTATNCDPEPNRVKFTISSLSTTASGGFAAMLWENAGEKNVPFVYAPWGNAVPSANEPHFTGEIDIPRLKPTYGGESGTSEFTFDAELLGSKGVPVLKVIA